jgi:hypothetical protein
MVIQRVFRAFDRMWDSWRRTFFFTFFLLSFVLFHSSISDEKSSFLFNFWNPNFSQFVFLLFIDLNRHFLHPKMDLQFFLLFFLPTIHSYFKCEINFISFGQKISEKTRTKSSIWFEKSSNEIELFKIFLHFTMKIFLLRHFSYGQITICCIYASFFPLKRCYKK